jgi:hypothetical protein
MSRVLLLCAFVLSLPLFVKGQTITDTQTLCKGTPIPTGYSIIGETDSKNCPNQAWIIRKKYNPAIDSLSTEKKPAPKMRQGGESATSGVVDKEIQKQWQSLYQWQAFAPPNEGMSVMVPGKPFRQLHTKNAMTHITYTLIAEKIFYIFGSTVDGRTKGVSASEDAKNRKEIDAEIRDLVEVLKEYDAPTQLFFDRTVSTNGFVGKQYRTISTSLPCVLRYYLKGKRAFFIFVLGSDEKDVNVSRFLNSFKFTKK